MNKIYTEEKLIDVENQDKLNEEEIILEKDKHKIKFVKTTAIRSVIMLLIIILIIIPIIYF